MNRSRRIVAMAQGNKTLDNECQSDQSSSAPSLEGSLLDCLEPGWVSDDNVDDPNFVLSPDNNSSSTDSEEEQCFNVEREVETLNQEFIIRKDNFTSQYQDDFSEANVVGTLDQNQIKSKENLTGHCQAAFSDFNTSYSITKRKKTHCKYCLSDVTNFERHLERNHTDVKEVIEMLSYPKKHQERKNIISLIRNSGHFNEFLKGNIYPKYGRESKSKEYYPCHRCKALLSKKYLSRHKKTCVVQKSTGHPQNKVNERAESQTMIACSLDENSTVCKLRVKQEVFSRMKADNISLIAKTDYLITIFGENYLKKHKREQIVSVCSNKMRELARFLLEFRKNTNNPNCTLQNILSPKLFDATVECAKRLGGYDIEKKIYKSPSLSAHLGTSLKQVCDIFIRLLLKEDPVIKVTNREGVIKETKRFKNLIETQWTTEISSLAFKNIQEMRWKKPVILPLTSDVKKFKEYVTEVADKAFTILKQEPNNKKEFKNLVEASLTLTILFNRRRIGDVQYTSLETYTEYNKNTCNQEEFENALSETEKILTKHYKRLVTGGKGSRAIAILFPIKLQDYIELFVNIRINSEIVPKDNKYLFGCPGTTKWTRGDVVIRRFAEKAGISNPTQISSNKLRKQIATVMQILNLSNDELDQFAQFMGHTQKTHNEFYKLPQDIYQTAKVSKLLLLMERGAEDYKGKSLNEININPEKELAEESDEEVESGTILAGKCGFQEKVTAEEKTNVRCQKIKINGRTPWNNEQTMLLKKYFKEHISSKKPPKKQECVQLIEKFPDILHNKDWVKIKTFIYNCYRQK
ncbi:unnamed protein product [Brassicogethes aeneus]|uniref:Uncharacterized protein n=1 Tax=Brassicogethes aeneus TaxID=1431903 RepID=A0A9P0FLE0_BRAAE|nr:unnamed protein product [Brassicogethes aeneus]